MKKVILLSAIIILSSCSIFQRKQLWQTQKEYQKGNYLAVSIKNDQLKNAGIYKVLYTIDEDKDYLTRKVRRSYFGDLETVAEVELTEENLFLLDQFLKERSMGKRKVYFGESYMFQSKAEVVMVYGDYTRLRMHGEDDIFDHKQYRTALKVKELLDGMIEEKTNSTSKSANESEM